MPKRNGRYSKELEQIKMLKAINATLKASDIENVLLSNSAKDSETVSDSVVDDMLGRVSKERERNREIFDIEKLTAGTYPKAGRLQPERAPLRQKKGRARPARTKTRTSAKRRPAQKRKKARR